MSEFRLKVFISVARNLSFTKASQELHISQPAISKHIKELEEHYSTRLFERIGTNIRLTSAGEMMLYHCEHILERYSLLEFEMNQLNANFSGELKIGASSTISQYVIPTLLAQFIKRYPDIKLDLLSGNSAQIESAILENKIDLGIVEGKHNNANLKYWHFLEDEIVLVGRSNGIYSAIDEITIEQLASLPLVLREYGSGTLEVIQDKLEEKSVKLDSLNITLHLGSTESIKTFIRQTDCVALISVRSITNELKAGFLKIIDITGLEFNREFRFITPLGTPKPLAEKFMHYSLSNNKKL